MKAKKGGHLDLLLSINAKGRSTGAKPLLEFSAGHLLTDSSEVLGENCNFCFSFMQIFVFKLENAFIFYTLYIISIYKVYPEPTISDVLNTIC